MLQGDAEEQPSSGPEFGRLQRAAAFHPPLKGAEA
jgi:hypothetical protein